MRPVGIAFQVVGVCTGVYALLIGEVMATLIILVLLSCHRIEEAIYTMRKGK